MQTKLSPLEWLEFMLAELEHNDSCAKEQGIKQNALWICRAAQQAPLAHHITLGQQSLAHHITLGQQSTNRSYGWAEQKLAFL